ncbi:MAG: SAM-dependent methyltransferase [Betaproteobacteria bacterium]|nr:SAM-dependent methyltransferase [Betaproteobacteria bacterium]
MNLPAPSEEARAHSEALARHIHAEIDRSGGWVSFARYLELALYAPGLGYYMAGARKLGADGDFVTAPEISPLFGRTLARQVVQVLRASHAEVLEVGAGSGALAAALLAELESMGALPERYLILELSPDLRSRSRDALAATVPHLLERVAWLNQLPPSFCGCIIGNEVLDAMPFHLVETRAPEVLEAGVAPGETRGFKWSHRPATGELLSAARELDLADQYTTEIGLAARGFIRSVAGMLESGAALFIDYGFPRHEYYHPQRSRGTLMCHYRHRAHDDPFFLPGLQDITTHIDFTAIAEAANGSGLSLLGYATQAQFLINCGITDLLAETPATDARAYLPLARQVDKLTSPAEMGELFKVFAAGRGVSQPLLGFTSGDKRHTL